MRNRGNTIKNLISITITLLFFAYLYINRDSILSTLKNLNLNLFMVVIVGQILVQISNSAILKSTIKPLGVNISKLEAFRVTTISSFVNFFTPVVGGASTKAVYLKSKYRLNYTTFASSLYANYILMFLVSFTFGAIGTLFIDNSLQTKTGILLILFFLGGAAGSLIFILAGHKILNIVSKLSARFQFLKKVSDKLNEANEGWENIRKNREVVLSVSVWSTFAMFSLLIIYWGSTHSIGLSTTLGSYMIYATLSSVSLLFNLTPGSIGVRETLYAGTYKLSGINLQSVVAFSLIDRVTQLIVLGVAWILFGNSIVKNIGTNEKQKPADTI